MTRLNDILFLNKILLDEMPEYKDEAREFAATPQEQRRLLRSLMNLRPPRALTEDFRRVQDALLREEAAERGVVAVKTLPTVAELSPNGAFAQKNPAAARIVFWQGDITRLDADAIVNAANSALLGCFVPCHGCIDNAIHSAAGLDLRNACAEIMAKQGRAERTGAAKITPAFNLPSKFVLHTVGPIVHTKEPTAEDADLLASCYRSCLSLAEENNLSSVAFCCISTGEFHYPNLAAAKIALRTVCERLAAKKSGPLVIFNVFKDEDAAIYRKLLGIER